LTIVKSFTELHGGSVDVKSVVGKGSLFTVQFPNNEVENQGYEEGVTTDLTVNKANTLIVLIEPDSHISKLLKTYLVQDGYNALALDSGSEALEQINRLNPTVICLNPNLPDMNGWELMKRIKRNETTARIPIVIVTVIDNRSFGKKMGAADFLVMPIQRDAFLSSIRRLVSKR